ncbi:MAG TPA: alkaline phosphatase family protein [Verrucomicrobiae bacterium]|nr:alkaline phosphatase family protein [Verrucomicrobiae bacterium]
MTSIAKIFTICAALASLAGSTVRAATPPKLIVAILIDQMRQDYLERFRDQFGSNGFRLFLEHGEVMTYAHYNYVPTVTAPGHASFLSGSTPLIHGIIANEWLDKKTGKDVYCVEDNSVDGVGTPPGKGRYSPRNFSGSTFADELRLRYGSKVVGVSMKDRGAILPAGKKPAGAYWFHAKTGDFVTSSYYMSQLPAWVKDFNQRKRPGQFMGQTWDRLLDKKFYLTADDAAGEGTLEGEKKPVFPHTIKTSDDGFDNIMPTPFGNQLLQEFAEAAIDGEKLGQGPQPDLLCVSFSSIDYGGHKFGPYSQEMQDLVLRLDQQLAHLFNFLIEKVGAENLMMVLTADHAVMPTPEYANEQGLNGQRLNETDFVNDLKERLAEEFGPGRYFLSSKIYTGNIYFNHATLQRKNLDPEKVFDFLREVILARGDVQACYSRKQLLDGNAPGPFGQLVINGYNPERGGDIVILPKPYVIPGSGKTGTTHGSAYSYDTHVPILFFGPAFKPGRYADEFRITDIVPTLCTALEMNEPAGNMGKPFLKMLNGQ